MGISKLAIALASMSFIPFYAAPINRHYSSTINIHASLGAPNLEVYEVNNVPKIENVKFGYADERVLRFKNVTKAVESRYNLPENILLSMMRHESGGNPLLPNLGCKSFCESKISLTKYVSSIPSIGLEYKPHLRPGDGGAGLIHMQPLLSSKYGIKTISNSTKLVDKEQGKLISKKLEETNYNLALMAVNDQRFNPVINVDAAGRMLADFYLQSSAKTEKEKWDYAIYKYSGRVDYPERIREFMYKIKDKTHLETIEKRFNKMNKNATIDGEQLTFDKTIDFYQRYIASQFDLDNYISQTKDVRAKIVPLIVEIQKNDYSIQQNILEDKLVQEKITNIIDNEQGFLYNFPVEKLPDFIRISDNKTKPSRNKKSRLSSTIAIKHHTSLPTIDSVVAQISEPKSRRKNKEQRAAQNDITTLVINNTFLNNEVAVKKSSKNRAYTKKNISIIEQEDPNNDEEYRAMNKLTVVKKELNVDKKENSISEYIQEDIMDANNIVPLITKEYYRKVEKSVQFYSDNIPTLQSIKHGLTAPIILQGSNKKSNIKTFIPADLLAEDFIAIGSIADELNRAA